MKEVVDMTPEEYKKFIFQSGVTRSDLGGEIIKMNAGGGRSFSGADAGTPYRWQVLSDVPVMSLNKAGVPMVPRKNVRAGQIIEGKQRMINTKSLTGNVWRKRIVIEIGGNEYVPREQVIEYVPKPTGEKGNFSGVEGLSISNIKNSVLDIAKTESVQVGVGVGALIGLGVSFLLGTNKIGTTVAGAVVFGWMGYEADSQAERQIQSRLFTEIAKK